MEIRGKRSIILLVFTGIAIWLYTGILDFGYSISTREQLMEPELEHSKGLREYIFESPLYILIALAIYLIWRIMRANRR